MEDRQMQRLHALQDIQRFADAHAERLGAVNRSRARAELDELLATLQASAARQREEAERAVARTAKKLAAKEQLLVWHMRPIVAIARSQLVASPMATELKAPKGYVRDMKLLEAGALMVLVCGRYRKALVRAGLAEDFIQQLSTAVDALREVTDTRELAALQRLGATTEIQQSLARSRAVVRVLDALVMANAGADRAFIAAWKLARQGRAAEVAA